MLAYDGYVYWISGQDALNGSISLAGNGTWKESDEIIAYWHDTGARMFKGTVKEIDKDNHVARCCMGDGDESWLPLSFIHKLVRPTLRRR